MPGNAGEITQYLQRLREGDRSAEEPLAEAVYSRMRELSRAVMGTRAAGASLQPTALANEVLLELIRLRSVDWQDRAHFFRMAARMLRRRLIDHIRRANRRPPQSGEAVDDLLLPSEDRFPEILAVHEGLDELALIDPSLAELIEMIYFGGVTVSAAAELRGVSEKTIDRHLDLGRRWLWRKLTFRPLKVKSDAYAFDRP
ncbi:MAG: RNA polymerase subunit sigma-70 [Bryobacterales bacterium]|nr:RNA polymerase subunit sigma-70 [Bryobacterales bacterium]